MEVQKEYETFLQTAIDNEEIYVLQGDDGLACQNAMGYEGAMCVLIWGSALSAEQQCCEDFATLNVQAVGLYEFLFRWLPNMAEDGVLCSINWREEEGGLEVAPEDLKGHLMSVLPEAMQENYRQRLEEEQA